MKLRLSISPCPNDTFMFDAMLNGRIDTEGLTFEICFADIEELNRRTLEDGGPDISKVSYAVLPSITGRYAVLNSGSALGHGNGPLLVSRREINPSDSGLKIAVPGIHTTANLLITRLFPRITDRIPVLFSEIAGRVANGEFDAGVLIHEGRFTYKGKGLRLVADLGLEWEKTTGAPLPLGAIAVKRGLPDDVKHTMDRVLRRSIEYAMANPDASAGFVRGHAREMSDIVTRKHIELFVNSYSTDLGDEGRRAVAMLTGLRDDDMTFIRQT